MRYIIDDIVNTIRSGQAFVLATIVRSEGSSPRGIGASMIVTADGAQHGTIGGGAVEFEATKNAVTLHKSHRSETQLYRLRPNEIADLGMICGGRAWVLFQYFAPDADSQALFEGLQSARQAGKAAYLVRRIQDGSVVGTGMYDDAGLHFAHGVESCDVGDHCAPRACLVPLPSGQTDQLLIEPVINNAHVYVFGGGHVSQKLVPALHFVDFRITVCDDRPDFANPSLFPAAENVILHPFDGVIDELNITANDYIVVMTRGHQADYEVLKQALRTPATYIGCIGSRHKVAVTKQRLLEEGFTDADFARVHTPIGLPILAETPEEVAISVVAELIAHRAKQSAQ